jgi:hypothetical protein
MNFSTSTSDTFPCLMNEDDDDGRDFFLSLFFLKNITLKEKEILFDNDIECEGARIMIINVGMMEGWKLK